MIERVVEAWMAGRCERTAVDEMLVGLSACAGFLFIAAIALVVVMIWQGSIQSINQKGDKGL